MIGMSQIKKKFYIGMGIGLLIGAVGITISGIISYRVTKSYEDGTNKKFNEKYTDKVNVAIRDIMQGTTVTQDMVKEVRVHKSTIPASAIKGTLPLGKVIKYNVSANTTILTDMLTDEVKTSDIRLQEINTLVMPTDLTTDEYVDIRIMYPNGTDYTVLAEKQVKNIVGDTIMFELNEDERLRLNSAIVDSFLEKGTKLYATKYADPDAQIKFETANEETVMEILMPLIESELPQLMNLRDYVEKNDLTDESVPNNEESNTENNKENSSKPNETLNKIDGNLKVVSQEIYDFIVKYRNLVASTTNTIENYQPNKQVMDAMRVNPNIIKEAKDKLVEDNRTKIENLINEYKNKYEEEYEGVVAEATESIQKQKEERNNLLSE